MEAALARVNDPSVRSFSDIAAIGLAISAHPHLGILYRDHEAAPDGAMMLHLAWHHDLRNEAARYPYQWVELTLEPERARPLARLCKLLWRKYGGAGMRRLKYALRYTGGTLDPAPEVDDFKTGEGIGLTCATFVLAVFASRRVFLVQIEEWLAHRSADREASDRAWQRDVVVAELRRGLADKRRRRVGSEELADLEAHIAAVESESGCARFRPEEVAAAATAAQLPAGFAYAEPLGRAIVERLRVSKTPR